MAMLIRDAVRADADAIAEAHIAAWRAAYHHIFPASIFEADDFDSSRLARWRAWTHSLTPDRRLQVSVDRGRVVGFVHSGHSDDEARVRAVQPESQIGELLGLYVHPDVWGSGAAGLLMNSAVAHLADLGHDRAVLWTLSESAQARRFYARSGWTETGRSGMWRHYPDFPAAQVEYAIAI